MNVEKYFNIHIPDPTAERIFTVQDLTVAVADLLNIDAEDFQLRENMLGKIVACLCIENPVRKALPTDFVAGFLPATERDKWEHLEQCLGFVVPEPQTKPHGNSWFTTITGLTTWRPDYGWNEITLQQFADATCMENYKRLINPKRIASRYEIYIAIGGITSDLCGIDCYEIGPDKAFVNDFGID